LPRTSKVISVSFVRSNGQWFARAMCSTISSGLERFTSLSSILDILIVVSEVIRSRQARSRRGGRA
jgi:hypothetical protein